jgi:DNA-binding MarR family transcriptional regulator
MERTGPSRHELRAFEGCLCLALRRTTRVVTQQFDAALRPFGVRATQLPILTAAAGGATVLAELAAALGMERTTLLRNVRPLVRRGLIVVRREKDGRRDEVTATTAGRALLQRVYPAWREVQNRLLADLKDPVLLRTLAEMGRPTQKQ